MKKQEPDFSALAEELAGKSNGRLDPEAVRAATKGNTKPLLDKLSPKERKRINGILNDPASISKIMNDPNMQKIISQLGGNKKWKS